MSAKHKYPLTGLARPLLIVSGGGVAFLAGAFGLVFIFMQAVMGADFAQFFRDGGDIPVVMISWLARIGRAVFSTFRDIPVVMTLMLALFLVGGAMAALTGWSRFRRRFSSYETGDTGIRKRGLRGMSLKWSDIEEVSLSEFHLEIQATVKSYQTTTVHKQIITPNARHRYYPQGHPLSAEGLSSYWLRLEIKGKGAELTLESPLSGFMNIIARVAMQIAGGRIEADDSTRRNFEILGHPLH